MQSIIHNISQRPAILLLALIAAAACVRFAFIQLSEFVWGVDTWSYVLNAEALLGAPLPDVAAIRPPLAPGYTLLPFIGLFGNAYGAALWSLAASLLPIPAAYYLGRGFLTERHALIGAGLVALSYNLTEAFVNGAVILQSIAVLLVALRILVDWSIGKPMTWRRLAIIAAATAIMPWLNQTFSAIYIIVFAVCLPVSTWERSRALSVGLIAAIRSVDAYRLTAALALGGAVALCALPWYWDVAPNSELTQSYLKETGQLGGIFGNLFPVFLNPYEDNTLRFWRNLALPHVHMFVAIAMLCVWAKAPRLIVAALLLMSALLMIYSSNEAVGNPLWRARYLGDTLTLLSLPLVFQYAGYWLPRRLKVGIAVAFIVAMAWAGCYVAIITDNSLTKSDHRAVVSAIQNAEGLGYDSAVTYYSYVEKYIEAFSDEEIVSAIHSDAVAARVIFEGDLRYRDFMRDPTSRELNGYCLLNFWHIVAEFGGGVCDPIAVADEWGVDYVLTTEAMSGFDGWPAYLRQLESAEWLTLVYERDGAGIWAIHQPR